MPEGPSIIIAAEAFKEFTGKKVLEVSGNTSIDKSRMLNKKVLFFKTWGKHLLIGFNGFTVRIHFLMFGTYLVNDSKDTQLRLGFRFSNGTLNLYTCAVKVLEGDIDEHYDWSRDVMNDSWNKTKAFKSLREKPAVLVCDALLDQDVFSGVGNIIKNEVLFRIRVHPESRTGKIPDAILKKLITEARTYSFQFLEWKKEFTLKEHWQIHTKKICPRCDLPVIKKYTGKTKRRSFFCTNCQVLYK